MLLIVGFYLVRNLFVKRFVFCKCIRNRLYFRVPQPRTKLEQNPSKLKSNKKIKSMAKVTVEGKFPKRIGNYVLYPLGADVVMRENSGFTSEALKTSPKYDLSRRNASEFGRLSSTCKELRLALKHYLPKKNNLLLVNALNKKMRQLLVFDITSVRGERTLANAMATAEGRSQLKGYHFNPVVNGVLTTTFNADKLQVSTSKISFPDGATSVGFTVVSLAFDFDTKASFLSESKKHFFNATTLPDLIELEVPKMEHTNGVLFTILVVEFYIQEDGGYVPLVDDGSKVVMIVD